MFEKSRFSPLVVEIFELGVAVRLSPLKRISRPIRSTWQSTCIGSVINPSIKRLRACPVLLRCHQTEYRRTCIVADCHSPLPVRSSVGELHCEKELRSCRLILAGVGLLMVDVDVLLYDRK